MFNHTMAYINLFINVHIYIYVCVLKHTHIYIYSYLYIYVYKYCMFIFTLRYAPEMAICMAVLPGHSMKHFFSELELLDARWKT